MPPWLPANVNVASPDATVPDGPPVMSASGSAVGEKPTSSTSIRRAARDRRTRVIDGPSSVREHDAACHVGLSDRHVLAAALSSGRRKP